MLKRPELQVLHYLTSQYVTGAGRIVDAGCFLGGSTGALASGLSTRTDQLFEKTIASYDLFRVEPYTLPEFRESFTDPTPGASFRGDFDRNIAPWARHVEVHEGDILNYRWTGEPIEVLFIDMAKAWHLNDYVLTEFFPHLIPGRSIIIQQDYMWAFVPWIHITMELMAPSVTILDSMLCSVVYLLERPVPKELCRGNLRDRLSPDTQLRLMDQAVNRWRGQWRAFAELSRVTLLREIYDEPTAQAALHRVLARHKRDRTIQALGKLVANDIANQSQSTH